MRITETAVKRIIKEELGRINEGLPGTGPRETFREIIRICEKALDDDMLGRHGQVARMHRDDIESLLRMMDDVETRGR
jgi:uncharacterized protein (UPF0216 family)